MYPYVLDSTGKSIQWIATHFKSSTVEMTSQGDERFANVLDLAIRYCSRWTLTLHFHSTISMFICYRFGKILIVQDVDVIDPILFPILRDDYVVQGILIDNCNDFLLIH